MLGTGCDRVNRSLVDVVDGSCKVVALFGLTPDADGFVDGSGENYAVILGEEADDVGLIGVAFKCGCDTTKLRILLCRWSVAVQLCFACAVVAELTSGFQRAITLPPPKARVPLGDHSAA